MDSQCTAMAVVATLTATVAWAFAGFVADMLGIRYSLRLGYALVDLTLAAFCASLLAFIWSLM